MRTIYSQEIDVLKAATRNQNSWSGGANIAKHRSELLGDNVPVRCCAPWSPHCTAHCLLPPRHFFTQAAVLVRTCPGSSGQWWPGCTSVVTLSCQLASHPYTHTPWYRYLQILHTHTYTLPDIDISRYYTDIYVLTLAFLVRLVTNHILIYSHL